MVIDYSLLKIIPADESHREFSYQVKKAAEGEYITQIWGWDEAKQRDFHTRDWEQKRPSVILYNGKAIGTIYILETNDFIQIGQFFILPVYQNKGIGSYILKGILENADRSGRITKITYLKNNPVGSLYKRHGFEVIGERDEFFFMERKPKVATKGGRKYRAVIFDLGGTLSRSAAWAEYRDAAQKIAEICAAPAENFIEQWFANSAGLGAGVYKTWQDYIRYVCRLMDVNVPESRLKKAADIPLSVTRTHICAPRDGSMELLSRLKSNGYKIGLISDCYYDVPEIWPETPFAPYFDVTVFSCEAGMNKGDPRIFNIALEKLAVRPEKCIYIADGMRNELTNAAGLGMHAVQLYVPGEMYDSPIREDWQGPKISSLKEVLNLL